MSKRAAPEQTSNDPSPQTSQLTLLLFLAGAVAISGALIAWTIYDSRQRPNVGLSDPPPPMAPPLIREEDDDVGKFEPTKLNRIPAPPDGPPGMAWIPGGEFSMGCEDPRGCVCGGNDPMPDARPIHRVYVDGYWIDKTEVTNAQFAKFVEATGYVTIAEQTPKQEDFPTVPPENLIAGSTVFTPTKEPVPLNEFLRWWRYERGADWRHPEGPQTNIDGKENYPVVHVAYPDVIAYCQWTGKRLPTEAEWEFAARGGQAGTRYTWGDDLKPDGKWPANIYQGEFPITDSGEDGFKGISPVAQFPPNPFGLFDMSGNVWEWCADWYHEAYYSQVAKPGTVLKNPQGPEASHYSRDPGQPMRVRRGGSFLCSDAYCTRYMLGTRGQGEISTASNHCGFRCVVTPDMWKARQTASQSSSGTTP